jgi:dTDP-4-amino-4,6-dideoxygalactose transaminase
MSASQNPQSTSTVPPAIQVSLSDVLVDDALLVAANDAVASGWWSMGPRVAAFEREFAEFCGVNHAFVVANGTAAIHIALLATGIGPGDEVIVPSLTFVAAANMVAAVGATPVFCDIVGDHDLNLDPTDVAAAITPRTRAIMPVHYGGYACDMDALETLCHTHDLILIEDAAHAPGAHHRGRRLGAIGTAGCFSFFSNKNLPVGEGGMITTSDDAVAEQIRLLRSHGMTTLTWDRHRGHASGYDVMLHGFNYRLDELRAAIGRVQLARLDDNNTARGRHVERYRAGLAMIAGVVMPFADQLEESESAYHLAEIVLPGGVDRNRVRESLAQAGVQTSVHYPPIHTFAAFASHAGARPLPRTDAVAERLLTLPLYPHLTNEQVDLVVDALVGAIAEGA